MLKSTFKPHLFPHDNIETATGLVGEHNARVVVISVGVHIKRHTEVYRTELVISCLKTRGTFWVFLVSNNNLHYTWNRF